MIDVSPSVAAMKLEQASPPPPLRGTVRCFEQRRARICGAAVVYPIAARPDQFLEFYLQERYAVRIGEFGEPEMVPRAVVVGPSTRRRAELVLRGELDVFTIQFHATAFYRLFRVPMDELADRAYDARSVTGALLTEIEQKLAEAPNFEQRIRVAGDFLMRRLEERSPADAVSSVANRFLLERGAMSVGRAAARAGLSVRQFERRFGQQVGLPPKLYARIVRFNAALGAKVNGPQRRWTDIAHEFGYFDQMHLIQDFEDFTGETPTTFMRRLNATPENRHDMKALAELFVDDAQWVNIVGMHWPGKTAVVAGHEAYHRTFFQATNIEMAGAEIREIAPGVATAVIVLKVGPFTPPDGIPRPESDDRLSLILTKRSDRWRIAHGHNTVIDPGAQRFDPVKTGWPGARPAYAEQK